MKPWQPWLPMFGVGAAAALALLAAATSPAARAWLVRWLWHPIIHDLGYNVANTTVLVVLAGAGGLWLALLFRHYGEVVDLRAAAGGLLMFFWGVTLRVFEDSDLFAPFASELEERGGAAGASCLPDPDTWRDCAGVMFITPLLWIWVALVMFFLARVGLHIQWLGNRVGQPTAQRHARIFLAGLAGLLCIPWLASPTWLAAAPNPLAPVLGAAAAALVLSRVQRLHWSHILMAGAAVLLASSAALIQTWFAGGTEAWAPHAQLRGYLIPLCLAALATILLLRRRTAESLARGPAKPPEGPAGFAPWLLLYFDLVAAALVFAGLVAVVHWEEGRGSLGAAWPLLFLLLLPVAAARWGRRRGDSRLALAGSGIGLLMLGGQAADAIVTAIGLDVFGAGEKHLLPRLLISAFERLDPPTPFSSYPTATVLIAYKLALVSLATWMLGVRAPQLWPAAGNFRRLVMLAVGFVGAAPALRNLLRMAMGI